MEDCAMGFLSERSDMYLVCGEALYDVFVDPMGIDVRRKVGLTAKAGGSPYNVAIGLARLGCAASLATEIADDALGRNLEARLLSEGVDCQFIRRTGKVTPLALVDVDAAGNARYAFYGLDSVLFHPDPVAVKKRWGMILGIHVGSIPIVSAQSSERLLELIVAAPPKVLISFDPNVRLAIEPDAGRWREAVERFRQHAHLIKVSEEDLTYLYGTNSDLNAIARGWLSNRCSLVIVTRGERGATYYSRSAGTIEIPPVPVVVADTIGAGDSFQAATLAWLVENRHASPAELTVLSSADIENLGQFAASAAAATCRHRGPEFPYRKTLRDIS
jgi:fructokinase